MTTHREEIDVPDNWTVASVEKDFGLPTESMFLTVRLKPAPPPEPCPFCGGELRVYEDNGEFRIEHLYLPGCPVRYGSKKYDTRLEAIQAANRRA